MLRAADLSLKGVRKGDTGSRPGPATTPSAIRDLHATVGNAVASRMLSSQQPQLKSPTVASTSAPQSQSAAVSYPPTADAFASIAPFDAVGPDVLTGKATFTPGVYRSTWYWVAPQCRRVGEQTQVFAYLAFNPQTGRNEFVVGPKVLSEFFAHERDYRDRAHLPTVAELSQLSTEETAQGTISQPPTADAFDDIALYYVFGDPFMASRDVFSRGLYKSKYYWLVPQCRRSGTTVSVYAYVAYNPDVNRREFIIAPRLLSYFFDHEMLFKTAAANAYPLAGGEPETYEVEHGRMVYAAFHGDTAAMLQHYGYSWRAAPRSRKFWVQSITATAPLLKGASPTTTTTPPPEPAVTTGTPYVPPETTTMTPVPARGVTTSTPIPRSGTPSSTFPVAAPVPAKAAPVTRIAPPEPTPPAAVVTEPMAILPSGRAIPPTSYVGGYHAPSEPITLEQAFREGFASRGGDWRLLEHAQPGSESAMPHLGGSAFRGTTPTPSSLGMSGQGAADWAGEGGYVYEIRNVPTWHLEQALEGQIRDPAGTFGRQLVVKPELESVVPGRIPPECIVRAGKVSALPDGRLVVRPGDWIANPNYRPR